MLTRRIWLCVIFAYNCDNIQVFLFSLQKENCPHLGCESSANSACLTLEAAWIHCVWFWKQGWMLYLVFVVSDDTAVLLADGLDPHVPAPPCWSTEFPPGWRLRKRRALVLLDLPGHVCPISAIKVFPQPPSFTHTNCLLPKPVFPHICANAPNLFLLRFAAGPITFPLSKCLESTVLVSTHPCAKELSVCLSLTCSEMEKIIKCKPHSKQRDWMQLLKQLLLFFTFNNVVWLFGTDLRMTLYACIES